MNEALQDKQDANIQFDAPQTDHMGNLHRIIHYAVTRQFDRLQLFIEQSYFNKRVFSDGVYRSADDFVYRMDITGLSYGQVLQMAYRDLKKGDDEAFLLSVKVFLVKLKANQRYTYFDRDLMRSLQAEMAAEAEGLAAMATGAEDERADSMIFDARLQYLPIGFQDREIEAYLKGSTRSVFDQYKTIDEKTLDNDYKTAVKQGNIYHFIVEIDHFINGSLLGDTDRELPVQGWAFLAKMLAAHYATERAPWSKDMTYDMMSAYLGLRDDCDDETFETMLDGLTAGTLKIIIKKISTPGYGPGAGEIMEVIRFLMNVAEVSCRKHYLDYVRDFMAMAERLDPQQDMAGIRQWLEGQE